MRLRLPLLVLVIVTILSAFAMLAGGDRGGHVGRSGAARRAFRRMHPCPVTGLVKGRCAGYVIDHIEPLACGGADAPFNMQWQTTAEAKAKDAVERKNCGK
jgi:hypothetical protein